MGRVRRANRARVVRGSDVARLIPAHVREPDRRDLLDWLARLVGALDAGAVVPPVPVVRKFDAESWCRFMSRAVAFAVYRTDRRWERVRAGAWRSQYCWLDLGRLIRFSELAESGAVRRECA